jgi:hypothetical protein
MILTCLKLKEIPFRHFVSFSFRGLVAPVSKTRKWREMAAVDYFSLPTDRGMALMGVDPISNYNIIIPMHGPARNGWESLKCRKARKIPIPSRHHVTFV